jgi:hypothetical protein
MWIKNVELLHSLGLVYLISLMNCGFDKQGRLIFFLSWAWDEIVHFELDMDIPCYPHYPLVMTNIAMV